MIYISTMASAMESGLVCRHCHSNNNNNKKSVAWCQGLVLSKIIKGKKTKTTTHVLASRSTGIGRRGLKMIMGCMDLLPPITSRADREHKAELEI